MMRSMTLALGLLCLALVTGCPLSTDVPLAEPRDGVVDDRLIGDWVGDDEDDGSFDVLVVPFNRNEYYAEIADEEKPTRFRFYVFEVGDERFLHIEELSTDRDHPEYVFARYEISDDSRLTVHLVGDEIVSSDQATDAPALVDFLARNSSDPALYDGEPLILRRPGAVD